MANSALIEELEHKHDVQDSWIDGPFSYFFPLTSHATFCYCKGQTDQSKQSHCVSFALHRFGRSHELQIPVGKVHP